MFSRITGSLVERYESAVLLDTGGLAYEVVLPACVAEKLPTQLGERVTLEIHPTFNLEGNSGRFTFFGFTNAIEREFFEALDLRGEHRSQDRSARVFRNPWRASRKRSKADRLRIPR